jgi:hypothetical protein
MCSYVENALVCSHVPSSYSSIMPACYQSGVPLGCAIEEHETCNGISVAHYCLYLFVAIQIKEPQLIIFCCDYSYLLVVIDKESVRLL